MANSSIPNHDGASIDNDVGIEHHNRTLPLMVEEIAELLPQPNLAEQFKEMQERLQALKTSNIELRGRLQAKRVTMRSAVVIPGEEPSRGLEKSPWSRS